jgi:hypothetical protein
MLRKLFDISNDLLTLEALLDEIGGDVTDETAEQAIDNWLAELQDEASNKLENYGHLIKVLESEAEALKLEADRLKAKQKATENKAARLKSRLETFLKINGVEKIQTQTFTFTLQKAGGKPRFILSDEFSNTPEELPEHLRRVKFEPDLIAIRAEVEADPKNCWIYGYIAEPEKRLRIK